MTLHESDLDLGSALAGRLLLDHPFYRRWEAGEVSMADLAAYAAQYRHFEGYLPGFLQRLAGSLPDGPARELVEANLADEQGDPVSHVELFERFATAVAAGEEAPSPAMTRLLATYEELLGEGPLSALAGFLAYEAQAADVARAKAEGLRRHHSLGNEAVSFWEHHADVDARHGDWAREALEAAGGGEGSAPDLCRTADAWWAFLDERETLARATAA